jgi:hypothetical protein
VYMFLISPTRFIFPAISTPLCFTAILICIYGREHITKTNLQFPSFVKYFYITIPSRMLSTSEHGHTLRFFCMLVLDQYPY